MSRLLKKRESSDTHTDLAKISFSYPPYKDLPGGKSDWPGIPWNSGLFRVFGWWYAVWIAAPLGVYFALFSFLFVSVSSFSVWYIINKSSKIRGALPCAALLWLEIEPVRDSLQTGRIFLDVVHLGDLRCAVAQEVSYLAR